MPMPPTSFTTFHPTIEQELVLALLGSVSEAPDREVILGLLGQTSWSEFFRVTEYALYPYLCYALDQLHALNAIPQEARAKLDQARQAAIIRTMRRQKDLRELLQLLERRGIPAIVLKGAALAYLVYPDPYTRYMADLDLLVPAAQVKSAEEAAQEVGWTLPVPRESLLPDQRRRHLLMVRKAERIGEIVEFHGDICSSQPPFRLDLESAWQRSWQVELNGIPARVLHPHDFLSHICLHVSSQHNFVRSLHWLLDVCLCTEQWEKAIDWDRLADECIQQESAAFVYLTFKLAHDLLQAKVPMRFFESLPKPRNLRQVETNAWDQIWYSNVLGSPQDLPVRIHDSGSLRLGVTFVMERVRAWMSRDSTSGNGMTSNGFQLRTGLDRFWWDLKAQAHRYKYNLKTGGYARPNLRLAAEVRRRRESFKKLTEDWK
jgi:hypothetical protein